MKKIILHIGFPKCASTTLQESVFFGLNSHKVNFLGRSRQLDKEANYILGNELMNKREGLNFRMPILKEGINVISDELLLIPNSLWNWRDRRNESNATFLKSEFGKTSNNILVLVVLRKQEDWIYSNYSFNYANLWEKGLYRKFDQVINDLKNESKVFNEFEFLDSLKPYSDAFGKENMKIVFLEELVDINSQSIKLLANLFDVTTEEMFSLINKKKNVQQKGDVMYRSNLNNKHLKRIWHFYNSNMILRRLKPIISKLSFLKKSQVLAAVTDDQKDQIFNLYKEYNKRFATEFNLADRMEKLKYF